MKKDDTDYPISGGMKCTVLLPHCSLSGTDLRSRGGRRRIYPTFASIGGRTWLGMKLHPYYRKPWSQIHVFHSAAKVILSMTVVEDLRDLAINTSLIPDSEF